jgi:hypothetical protein
MGIKDFFGFGPKHQGQHEAKGQRGSHAGKGKVQPAAKSAKQKRVPSKKRYGKGQQL